jgi:hypothetical protein
MPGDADPFVIAHQMRLGGAVDAQALRLQHGAQIGAGAALAIGARDMEHGRQMVLRIAQRVQQGVDHLQPESPLRQAERAQPGQLRRHPGVIGCREIAHGCL